MSGGLKGFLRDVAPAGLRRWWRRHFGWQWFRGNYPSWAEARRASAGYDDAAVLARVLAATREVKAGRAQWERDGVTFDEPSANPSLLAALRAAAEETGGRLDVVDFGGSLGSTWWQHRAKLGELAGVRWRVVEQPHYVSAGREFADATLSFHESIAAALGTDPAEVILLSSVLPYLERPDTLLADVAGRNFRHVIIDRTPIVAGSGRLTVQHAPAELGGGSYPCWLFEQKSLLAPFRDRYRVVAEWRALDDLAPDVEHRGIHLRRLT